MEVKKTSKADLQNKKTLFMEIGLAVALLLMILAFSWSQAEVVVQKMEIDQAIVETEMVEITREEITPPEVQPAQVQVTADIIKIVSDDKKIDASLTFSDFDQLEEITFVPVAAKVEEVVEDDTPFMSVEEMPTFQGGDQTVFRTWVQSRLKYPVIAQENGVQGRVTVAFVVERDGSVSNIEILSTPDRSLSEEATRVIQSSPKWTPGKQRGMPVRVKFTLPVEFRLG